MSSLPDVNKIEHSIEAKNAALMAGAADNYTQYGSDERQVFDNTSRRYTETFREFLVGANEASNGFFAENFTIDGLPFLSTDQLDAVIRKYPLLKPVTDAVALDPYTQYKEGTHPHNEETSANHGRVSPFYFRLIGMNADGSPTPLPKTSVTLRGDMYFFAEDEMEKRIREVDSVEPGIEQIEENFRNLSALHEAIISDPSVPDVINDPKERLVFAAVVDHIRNYALMHFTGMMYLAHGSRNPDLLKKFDSGNALAREVYQETVENWLTNNQELQASIDGFERNYQDVFEAINVVIEAYHTFLLTGEMAALKNVDQDSLGLIGTLIGQTGRAAIGFENWVNKHVVNGQIEPVIGSSEKKAAQVRTNIKRGFFKKLLRHERDADHPGVNMLHVFQAMNSTDADVVLGLAYGGIEYPFLYSTVAKLTEHYHGIDNPQLGFLLLSNYNLGYTPSTAPLLERHLFPRSLKVPTAGTVLIIDDNAVTGKTVLQAETAVRTAHPDTKVVFAAADINVGPQALRHNDILGSLVLALSLNGTRRMLTRDNKARLPHHFHASRYTMKSKPRGRHHH